MRNQVAELRARVLLAMLINARTARGVSGNQLAKMLGVSQSKLARWDRGETLPSRADVVRVLNALEVDGEERAHILEAATPSSRGGWLGADTRGVTPQLFGLLDAERDARRITEYNPMVIPGKLQTGDYAMATMADPSVSDGEREVRVMARMGRSEALRRRDHPAQMHALIGEHAIYGRLGGPEVMRDALLKVQAYAKLPNVTVQVVPLATVERWHPGLLPGVNVFEFDPPFPPMAYVEHYSFGQFLVDVPPETVVADLQRAVEWIAREAWSPEDSLTLIADQITVLEGSDSDRRLAQGVSESGIRGVRGDPRRSSSDPR